MASKGWLHKFCYKPAFYYYVADIHTKRQFQSSFHAYDRSDWNGCRCARHLAKFIINYQWSSSWLRQTQSSDSLLSHWVSQSRLTSHSVSGVSGTLTVTLSITLLLQLQLSCKGNANCRLNCKVQLPRVGLQLSWTWSWTWCLAVSILGNLRLALVNSQLSSDWLTCVTVTHQL